MRIEDAIIRAERTWRKERDARELNATGTTINAEQDAWDAYVDLCDDIDQCQFLTCRETVPEYALCPKHRPR